jgi:hypothetical protein
VNILHKLVGKTVARVEVPTRWDHPTVEHDCVCDQNYGSSTIHFTDGTSITINAGYDHTWAEIKG